MSEFQKKKQRGQYRKLRTLFARIDEFTPFQDTTSLYEHFHVPSSMFIQHLKTYGKVKTAFSRKWIEATEKLIAIKPIAFSFCKVVALIDEPYFWNSQIIIFYDEKYYNNFWDRKDSYQFWTPLKFEEPQNVSFVKRRNVQTSLLEKGYTETINEEEYTEHSMLWFYGELPNQL